jgi:rhodanese-related sulfurtransferase
MTAQNRTTALATLLLSASLSSLAFAAEAASTAAPKADEKPWTYKTQRLSRAQLDKLLAHPQKLLFIDVRRPDEVTALGSFPVYLSVQAGEVEKNLDFIPKGRSIVTISNRAHRAGAVGDLLTAKGYAVAGAVGTKDYEEQGGTVTRIAPPPAPAGAATTATAPATPPAPSK